MVTTAGSTRPQASLLSWASMPRLRSAPGSGPSGAESHPVEQLLHVGCRLVERRPWGGLASQSPVKLDLQNLRDLIIDRRHRPGHRILDDSEGHLRRNLELAPELVTLIQAGARGVLAHDPGSFPHLLWLSEIVDDFPGCRGILGMTVDRELGATQCRGGASARRGRHGRDAEASRYLGL